MTVHLPPFRPSGVACVGDVQDRIRMPKQPWSIVCFVSLCGRLGAPRLENWPNASAPIEEAVLTVNKLFWMAVQGSSGGCTSTT